MLLHIPQRSLNDSRNCQIVSSKLTPVQEACSQDAPSPSPERLPMPVSTSQSAGRARARDCAGEWCCQAYKMRVVLAPQPCQARMTDGRMILHGGRPTREVKHVREGVEHSEAALVGLPSMSPMMLFDSPGQVRRKRATATSSASSSFDMGSSTSPSLCVMHTPLISSSRCRE